MQGTQPLALVERDTPDTDTANQPLAIVVTSAAIEELALRGLARQALAYLRSPESFTPEQRQELSWAMGRLLDATDADDICGYGAGSDREAWEEEPWP